MQELIGKNLISSNHVKPLVECACEIFEAFALKRIPNYDKVYRILKDHLYPNGKQSPRIVYDWLTDGEKATARKVHIISIDEIPNRIAKP